MKPVFQIYESGSQWRWRLLGTDGQTVCGGPAYATHSQCYQEVLRVQHTAPLAQILDLTTAKEPQ